MNLAFQVTKRRWVAPAIMILSVTCALLDMFGLATAAQRLSDWSTTVIAKRGFVIEVV